MHHYAGGGKGQLPSQFEAPYSISYPNDYFWMPRVKRLSALLKPSNLTARSVSPTPTTEAPENKNLASKK